jgi:carboxylate-amine ligase
MYPHHVDLRAFVHLRPDAMNGVTAEVIPAGLTRVAAHGSRIVNSSSGGGSKDTWILTGGPDQPSDAGGPHHQAST